MAAQIITGSTVKKGDRPLCVGVDVGGTWIRVSASGGRRPATTTVTRADRDLRRLAPLLRAIWRRRGWRPDRVAALVVASRAIWTAPECRALARRLTGLAQRVRVVADAQAALLGALGDRPGLLVLAGTGSIVIGYDGGRRWARAGGLGPLLGDEGPAFWLRREWLPLPAAPGGLRPVPGAAPPPHPVAPGAAGSPPVLRPAPGRDAAAPAIPPAG